MIQGIFIPSEYSATINGKTYEGKCADVTKETTFDGLDKMSAFGLIVLISRAFKFDGEDFYTSLNKGGSFQYSFDTFKMNGDRVIMIDKYKNEIPESKSGLMTYKNDILTILNYAENGQVTITYKKQ